jgi:DNA polymerase I
MGNTDQNSKELYLLDAYALIYRAYFAFIRNPRFNSAGLNTSAIFGFVVTLEQLLASRNPRHIAVVFDVHADTFRHEMYAEYKANREAMPEDLRLAVPYIRQIIQAYNIPIIELAGYEADDVIGTIAAKAEDQGYTVYMMTPDKDYAQLVTEKSLIYKPAKNGNDAEVWGIKQVQENFEVDKPQQVIDVLGLMGDASDNIPGCPGIGPKTAMKLIKTYGSIDGVYAHIDELKGKMKENLISFKEQVYLSRQLVIIDRHVPVAFDLESMVYELPNKEKLLAIYQELDFRSMAIKLQPEPKIAAPKPIQGSLFDFDTVETHEAPEQFSTIDTVVHQYFKVETAMQRASLRAELAVADYFCFDTETTSVDAMNAGLVCLSFAFKPHQAYCVMLPKYEAEAREIIEEFRDVFEDERTIKVGQNLKYDMLVLANYGIKVKGKLFDTMLAHYLIQPELRHNLDYLCEKYLGYRKVSTESLIGEKGRNQRTMWSVEPDLLVKYACEDADLTLQLMPLLRDELAKNELTLLFDQVEMPLVEVLVHMEQAGVKVDLQALNDFAEVLKVQIISVEEEIHQLAGTDFLVSSPKQLGIILFEKLKIDSNAKTTKTKQYSTSEETLARLADRHPIVNKVLEFRGLKKLLNTYVEALPQLINPKTGRIHTSYNQAVTATGRLSSTNPNLQNIPIRDDNGREIRKAFIPADEQHVYLSADYSQIELRIMAHLSEDPAMIEAFMNNADIHAITASRIFKIPVDEVTSEMRRKAKTANFGIIYGISSFGLAQRLNIGRSEAKDIIDGYFEAFPRVKKYMDECIENARQTGYVQTLLGRKRYLPDILSANATVRGLAERNAINAPIQGSAADIIKIAMINIFKAMQQQGVRSKLILQVHDELNFDVLSEELAALKTITKQCMEAAIKLKIPLTVDMNSGSNWLEAH